MLWEKRSETKNRLQIGKKNLPCIQRGNTIILKYQIHMRATNKCTVWSMERLAGNEQGGGPAAAYRTHEQKTMTQRKRGEKKEETKRKTRDETAPCHSPAERVICAPRLFMRRSCLPEFISTIPAHLFPPLSPATHYLRTRVIHNSFFRLSLSCPACLPTIFPLLFFLIGRGLRGPHKNKLWSGAPSRTDHQPGGEVHSNRTAPHGRT